MLERQHSYSTILLMACIGISTYGTTLCRPVLQSGVVHLPWAETLQFTYPFTVTLFQLSSTFFLLLPELVTPSHYHSTWLLHSHFQYSTTHEYSNPEELTSKDATSGGETRRKSLDLILKNYTYLEILPLAIGAVAEAVLAALLLFHSPVEIYIVSRALVIPIFLAISQCLPAKRCANISGPIHSTILYSIVLSASVILAGYRPGLVRSKYDVWSIIASPFFTAVYYLQVQNFNRLRRASFNLSENSPGQHTEITHSKSRSKSHSSSSADQSSFWELLRKISLAGSLILLPIVVYSDELGQISRNCYFTSSLAFWLYTLLGGVFRFIQFTTTIIFIRETSAFAALFWSVLTNVSQLPMFSSSKLLPSQVFGLIASILIGIVACLNDKVISRNLPTADCKRPDRTHRHETASPWWGIITIFLLASGFVGLGYLPGASEQGYHGGREGNILLSSTITAGKHDYLGVRPNANMLANFTRLVEYCRGTYRHVEHIRNVSRCLDYLAEHQEDYLYIGQPSIGSELGSIAPLKMKNSIPSTLQSTTWKGNVVSQTCDGRVIPFHLWWTGPPSWRIELFIKSYFFTQNLPCSRLWIWINADQDGRTRQSWLDDTGFQRFRSFVDRGDLILIEWRLPSRVPLSQDIDILDKARYYERSRKKNNKGESYVADSVIRDISGQEWLQLFEHNHQLKYFTVASSDAARLIILHLHGGVYVDADMILLRDLRPLLLPNKAFAERWGSGSGYNNALVALPANSSLSSYILRGGARMGLVYHFEALYRMLFHEGRDDTNNEGLIKLENAFFDPAWIEIDGVREGRCTTPCLTSFNDVFKSTPGYREWESFDRIQGQVAKLGENNRTLENFFRGAWAYHIHNRWHAKYEPGSWIDVICATHDNFFQGLHTNPYGENWTGPAIENYGLVK